MTNETKQQPLTWVRIALYDGVFEEALRRYDLPFVQARSILGNSKTFVLYDTREEPYLITTSKGIKGTDKLYNFNVQFTLTSLSDRTNQAIAKRFEDMTGLVLRSAPRGLPMKSLGTFAYNETYKLFQRVGPEIIYEEMRVKTLQEIALSHSVN